MSSNTALALNVRGMSGLGVAAMAINNLPIWADCPAMDQA
ncbi:hypothetical protein RS9917_13558 [Synechococcus sp. RS9917]|nr:hypothetical protein RS9917_13558 [Synechococcus sp. RS9917]